MCCHRLYVYNTCGHSVFSPSPLVVCRFAEIPPHAAQSTTCKIIAHPYQSWKIDSLCPECQQRRARLLEQVEITQVIQFDEWRWKVSYGMPAHGKDFWGKKAEEREKKEGSVKTSRKRFSWKRSRRRDKEKGEEDVRSVAGVSSTLGWGNPNEPKTPNTPRRH